MKNSLIIGAAALALNSGANASNKELTDIEVQTLAQVAEICRQHPEIVNYFKDPKEVCDFSTDNGLSWKEWTAIGGGLSLASLIAAGALFRFRSRKGKIPSDFLEPKIDEDHEIDKPLVSEEPKIDEPIVIEPKLSEELPISFIRVSEVKAGWVSKVKNILSKKSKPESTWPKPAVITPDDVSIVIREEHDKMMQSLKDMLDVDLSDKDALRKFYYQVDEIIVDMTYSPDQKHQAMEWRRAMNQKYSEAENFQKTQTILSVTDAPLDLEIEQIGATLDIHPSPVLLVTPERIIEGGESVVISAASLSVESSVVPETHIAQVSPLFQGLSKESFRGVQGESLPILQERAHSVPEQTTAFVLPDIDALIKEHRWTEGLIKQIFVHIDRELDRSTASILPYKKYIENAYNEGHKSGESQKSFDTIKSKDIEKLVRDGKPQEISVLFEKIGRIQSIINAWSHPEEQEKEIQDFNKYYAESAESTDVLFIKSEVHRKSSITKRLQSLANRIQGLQNELVIAFGPFAQAEGGLEVGDITTDLNTTPLSYAPLSSGQKPNMEVEEIKADVGVSAISPTQTSEGVIQPPIDSQIGAEFHDMYTSGMNGLRTSYDLFKARLISEEQLPIWLDNFDKQALAILESTECSPQDRESIIMWGKEMSPHSAMYVIESLDIDLTPSVESPDPEPLTETQIDTVLADILDTQTQSTSTLSEEISQKRVSFDDVIVYLQSLESISDGDLQEYIQTQMKTTQEIAIIFITSLEELKIIKKEGDIYRIIQKQ